MRVPPQRLLNSPWRLLPSLLLFLFPASSLSSFLSSPRLGDATHVSATDMSRTNAGPLGLAMSSARAITTLGTALMGSGLQDVRTVLVIIWPLLESARCFYTSTRLCVSDTRATVVSLKRRLFQTWSELVGWELRLRLRLRLISFP